jgi:hypothetical protein
MTPLVVSLFFNFSTQITTNFQKFATKDKTKNIVDSARGGGVYPTI